MSDPAELDPKDLQRLAADPKASVWVSASAGTGKTKVLTDRVLGLLLAGSPPERILCLTFTKAAAAEMAIRIGKRLSQWATIAEADLHADLRDLTGAEAGPAAQERARQLFARVLDAPGGLRIETIHAFCQSLLRRFPLESGIPPHFRVMEERSAAEAMERALSQVLDRARDGKNTILKSALDAVTELVGEDSFAELLAKLAAERGKLGVLRAGGDAKLAARIRAALGLAAGETAEAVVKAACQDGAFDAAGLQAAARALAQGSDKDKEHGALIAHWLERPPRRARAFDDYCGVFLTQEGEPRARLATKAAIAAAPGIGAALAAEADRLEAACQRRDSARLGAATLALARLGGAVLDTYEKYKSARALLDFDDLVLKSRDLLLRPGIAPWVLYKLDGGIDHILIDEAQDTNPEQWQVVAALAEEFFTGSGARETLRTVFAVGDPKQSIFSFQRADPDAFTAMRAHFQERVERARQIFKPLALRLSYRSVAAVLDTVDRVFADARVSAGVAPAGETIRHIAQRAGQAGLVELWPPIVPEEDEDSDPWNAPLHQARQQEPKARLALAIAATVKSWLDQGETLQSSHAPIRPGDIMVLVRQRGPFVGALVRALKERDVPVAGVDRMVLADQLAVQDLVALAQFLLLPADELTLAAVLKGPLYGFDDDRLFALAHDRKAGLWDTLRRRAGENAAFKFAAQELGELLARVDFIPPFELFSEILGARGGRRKVLARLGPEAGDPLDELLAAALAFERDHGPSLQGFLHWLVLGELDVKRDLNNEAGRDELRVITVHGAKGLQAPIVFLPDTLRAPRGRHGVVWSGETPLWLVKPGARAPAARTAKAEADRKQGEEYRRLLYVAMTRAEDRLYVCGWQGKHAPPEDAWHPFVQAGLKAAGGKSFAFDKTGLIGADGWKGEGWRLEQRQQGKREAKKERRLARQADRIALPLWATTPPEPEPSPPKPLQPSQPHHAEPASRSPLGADQGRIFRKGLLVHRLLQSLPLLAADKREAAARRFLARPVWALPVAEQAQISAETLRVLNAPEHAALFGPGSAAEVPVVGLINGRALSGRIDRLLVTEHEVLIVDYKTMRPVPQSESEVPAAYREQLAAYQAALARVYPGKTVRCALLWTEGPVLMPVSAESLAASLA